ncbi:hypothetical protein LQL77_30735 [Rhodococcus cerastii]|nr:hypothetical protein [Rhodococcus cerastii]
MTFLKTAAVLTGVAAALVAAPLATAATATHPAPPAPAAPAAPAPALAAGGQFHASPHGWDQWGWNHSGFFVEIVNQKTNDAAELVRPLFGNTSSFLIDGQKTHPEIIAPNSHATLFGTGTDHPDNMDFIFTMRDRHVHAWIRVTDDGKVKPTCDLDADPHAVCYFGGLDKNGYLTDPTKILTLHLSYDVAGPQPR